MKDNSPWPYGQIVKQSIYSWLPIDLSSQTWSQHKWIPLNWPNSSLWPMGQDPVSNINPLTAELFLRNINYLFTFILYYSSTLKKCKLMKLWFTLKEEQAWLTSSMPCLLAPYRHGLIGPWKIWMKFQVLNFLDNFSDWWLSYLLWTCPQMNVTRPYWW